MEQMKLRCYKCTPNVIQNKLRKQLRLLLSRMVLLKTLPNQLLISFCFLFSLHSLMLPFFFSYKIKWVLSCSVLYKLV